MKRKISQRAIDFMRDFGMLPQASEAVAEMIKTEMLAALAGKSAGISAIPSYLDMSHRRSHIGRVCALDVGGTNVRAAECIIRTDGSVEIARIIKESMPGRGGAVSADGFYDFLIGLAEKTAPGCEYLGVSFAYEGTITPQKDCLIAKMCKEVVITGIEKQSLAVGLNSACRRAGFADKKICAVNDTAAALIGAMPPKDLAAENGVCAGIVVGTGFNVCYREDNINIAVKHEKYGSDIIVSESGCFDKIHRGFFDDAVDAASLLPGDHYFEKLISGRYLPLIFIECMKQAAKDGLVSQNICAAENVDGVFLNRLTSCVAGDDDTLFARDVCALLIKRAASYAAANVAAALTLHGEPRGAASAAVEGSTIMKLNGFMPEFTETLGCMPAPYGTKCRIISGTDSVIKGAATAVTM